MSLFQVVVLAIIQGFTEFLPISSSAHLALTPWLLGWPDQGLSFDIALHFGTLAAVLIYFFRDWLQIIGQGLGMNIGSDPELRRNRQLLWFLVAGSIPIGIAGVLLKHQAEEVWRHQPYLIGGMLIGVGLLMAVGERVGRKIRDLSNLGGFDAVAIGLAQAIAVVPGTSRSGITITAGLFRDFDRQAAARFSFLLSTPAIAAAGLKDFYDLMKHGGLAADLRVPFAVGIVVSAVTGCLVIGFFMRYLRRSSLNFFVGYRIIFGILVIALAYFRGFAG